MSRIIVTGSTGLVGTNLVTLLESKGHKVLGLSRETGYDLRDEKATDKIFAMFKPEIVYHLAAFASEAVGQVSPVDMTQRNIGIFVNVLKAAINSGIKKFVYTSSVAVYGEATIPYKEDGLTIPKDVYGVNKLASEQILKIMSKVYGFEYIIFRPHNIYGPGQKMNDPSKNVVALFMRKLIEKEPYTLFGEGKMKRAFSYVDDVVDVMVDSLNYSNFTMNIGAEQEISIKELSDVLQEITGLTTKVELKPGRPQEISMFLADHGLQRKLFKYKETSLFDGLNKTWKWVKKNKLPSVIIIEKEINV